MATPTKSVQNIERANHNKGIGQLHATNEAQRKRTSHRCEECLKELKKHRNKECIYRWETTPRAKTNKDGAKHLKRENISPIHSHKNLENCPVKGRVMIKIYDTTTGKEIKFKCGSDLNAYTHCRIDIFSLPPRELLLHCQCHL